MTFDLRLILCAMRFICCEVVSMQLWLYVATVLDLYIRREVGWTIESSMTKQLAADALMMVVGRVGKTQELLRD